MASPWAPTPGALSGAAEAGGLSFRVAFRSICLSLRRLQKSFKSPGSTDDMSSTFLWHSQAQLLPEPRKVPVPRKKRKQAPNRVTRAVATAGLQFACGHFEDCRTSLLVTGLGCSLGVSQLLLNANRHKCQNRGGGTSSVAAQLQNPLPKSLLQKLCNSRGQKRSVTGASGGPTELQQETRKDRGLDHTNMHTYTTTPRFRLQDKGGAALCLGCPRPLWPKTFLETMAVLHKVQVSTHTQPHTPPRVLGP